MAKKIRLLNKLEAPKKQGGDYRPDPLVRRLLQAPPGKVMEWHVSTNPAKKTVPEPPEVEGPDSRSTNTGKKRGRSVKYKRKKLKKPKNNKQLFLEV